MPMSNKNIPKILFRCDSSSTIGYGHLHRSLALAHQLKPSFDIHFACLPLTGCGDHLIAQSAFTLTRLEDNAIETLIALAQNQGVWMVVFDHYEIDSTMEQSVRSAGFKIAVFDDLYLEHSCDILINGAPYADKIRYRSHMNDTQLLLQTPYFPLRQEFWESTVRARSSAFLKHAVINFGATDPNRITSSLLPLLIHDFETITILTTSANRSLQELREVSSGFPYVRLVIDSSTVAAELGNADVFIGSASTICIEALSLSLPCIVYQSADNQSELTRYFQTFFGTETVLESITKKEWKRVYDGMKKVHAEILEKCTSLRFSHDNLLEVFRSIGETKD